MKYLLLLLLAGCTCTGVIGAAYNKNNIVAYTYSNSPAERAGVLKGDELINPKSIPGKRNTAVTFKFIRDKKVYERTVVRKCIKDIKKWKTD